MPIYEYRCPVCGHEISRLFRAGYAPMEVVDEAPDCSDNVSICVYKRIPSVFNGKFGDTPVHHPRAPRQ